MNKNIRKVKNIKHFGGMAVMLSVLLLIAGVPTVLATANQVPANFQADQFDPQADQLNPHGDPTILTEWQLSLTPFQIADSKGCPCLLVSLLSRFS